MPGQSLSTEQLQTNIGLETVRGNDAKRVLVISTACISSSAKRGGREQPGCADRRVCRDPS